MVKTENLNPLLYIDARPRRILEKNVSSILAVSKDGEEDHSGDDTNDGWNSNHGSVPTEVSSMPNHAPPHMIFEIADATM